MFYAGQQIGVYFLIEKLGTGGFGEVWLAEKRSGVLTKKVAVKLPHPDSVNLEAIKQEAALWEQVSKHENVLTIFDADIFDGQVAIISEYAEDGSLADKLKAEGKLPLEQAVEITIGILRGLDHLHSKYIIHRDIKPQNILLQGQTPLLADFGISRAMNTSNISSVIIGTDSYMAPEALDGVRNAQTDIWSVGVVLYQLLKGDLPFPQEHYSERMFAILTKDFAPLPDDVPLNLKEILRKALAKKSEERFQTASEMGKSLHTFLTYFRNPTFAPTEVFPTPVKTISDNQTIEENQSVITKPGSSPSKYEAPPTQISPQTNPVRPNDTAVGQEIAENKQVVNNQVAATGLKIPIPQPAKPGNKIWLISITVILAIVGLLIFKPSISNNTSGDSTSTDLENSNINIIAADKTADSKTAANSSVSLTNIDYFQRGLNCGQKKDYDCAIENYTKAINLNPSDSASYNNRGNAYMDKGNYDQAIRDYNKAIETNPDNPMPYNNRGMIYATQKGDHDQAIKDYNKSIELKPDYADAYCNRGISYRTKGNSDQAIRDCNKAIELRSDFANAYLVRGNVYDDKGDYVQAIADYKKALSIDPNVEYGKSNLEKTLKKKNSSYK